ncbi:MAG: multidrug efflux RND transporter permease subunit [Desulfobacterales bacterium]|nr:multidrug efflux RND transporter permease subunit [Desulfobacterales bacterium]
MFSRFFIHRPVFAVAVSVVIVMAGLVLMQSLPIAQYPEIAPPRVQVTATYPGANAKVLAATVAQPIEEQVNGVENMLYMNSTSTNNGQYTLTVSFEIGTDIDMAMVMVQNRVAQAEAQLPEEVQRMGISVNKQSSTILMFASVTSPDERYDSLFLNNYVTLHIKDQLSRLQGVGSVMVFGASDYSMRIWLDPDRLKALGLTTTEVISAIREQNVQVAAGQIGQMPVRDSQTFQYAVNVRGRLEETGEFEDIVIKTLPGSRMIRIKDVARVELGAEDYNVSSQANGKDSAAIGIYLQPGANALAVADRVKERMAQLSENFPPGLAYDIPFDATTFVEVSIDEVVTTLFITVILVVMVILVFLQNWRASLIPVLTIPVSLIGTLAVMAALDVSINMLSLFGLVLAIGIVVDDAIVVVENAMRHIRENRMAPREAAVLTMKEVTGPVVATTLVLLSVFVPTAFMGGTTGELYRQFALTIASATVFSTINALTLSPALSAMLLKPSGPGRPNIFARGFNRCFDRVQSVYGILVAGLIRRAFIMLILFAGITGAAVWGFIQLPKGFVPAEDQGWALIAVQLPDAASLDRTKAVVNLVNDRLKGIPGIENYVSVPGFSILDMANASNAAVIWTVFEPWEKRLPRGLDLDAMIGQIWGAVAPIQEANIFAFPPPAILGLGAAGGFTMQIQDRNNLGLERLQQEAMKMMTAANGDQNLSRVFSTFRANVPQIEALVDRNQVKSMDIPLSDVFDTLQANLGSVYVNDFNKFGKTYQVRVQADAQFRSAPGDISRLEVKSRNTAMIPLGSVVEVAETLGPQTITRHNLYPSAMMNGQGTGISSGQAMEKMETLAGTSLPKGMGFEWTDMSFQEKTAQGQTLLVLLLAVFCVYLVLCAQYESLSLPLSVILSVPLALLGTVAAVAVRGMDINVYTQIGLILLVALSCKTAILITEFAKISREEGQSIFDAAFNAARLRFRPILMTAATFILGMVPLVVATGAGANSRQALGTAVFSGMLAATVLLIFFVPAFYALIQRAGEALAGKFKSRSGSLVREP